MKTQINAFSPKYSEERDMRQYFVPLLEMQFRRFHAMTRRY